MAGQPPEIESRSRRLAAYLAHNRDQMLVDLSVALAWIVVASAIFGTLGLPAWLLYVVLFSGIIVYTRITPTWERPYRSPDLPETTE